MPYSRLQFVLLCVCYLELAIVAAFFAWRHGREALAATERLDRYLVPLAAGLGLLLRLVLPIATVFHENGHGFRYIGMAVEPTSDLHVYGSGYQAFFFLLYRLFPPLCSITLDANIILGALTVLLVGCLAHRLFGKGAGAAAALCLATNPLHIRLSATESPFILTLFLLMLALAAVAELRRRPAWELAILAGLAAAAAAQIRPVFMLAPVMVVAFAVLVAPGGVRFLRTRDFVLLLGSCLLFLGGHIAWMMSLHLDGAAPSHYSSLLELTPGAVWRGLTGGALLTDPAATPPVFWVLGALGTVAAFFRNPRAAGLLLLFFLGSAYVYAARSGYYTEALRFGVPAQVFLAALCGPGVVALTRGLGRLRMTPAVAWGVACACLATSLLSRAPFQTHTAQELEYRFLQAAYEQLPRGCALVKPTRFLGAGQVNSAFPFDEYQYHLDSPTRGEDGLIEFYLFDTDYSIQEHTCRLYYRGLACFSMAHSDVLGSALHPDCRRFEQRWELEPVLDFDEINSPHLRDLATRLGSETRQLTFSRLHSPGARSQ